MKLKSAICVLAISLIQSLVLAQTQPYEVTLAPFSSEKYDEFSPVFYKNGIVFCSNRFYNKVSLYSSSQDQEFFKIYYVDSVAGKTWRDAKIFSDELKTKLNDGPVTFSSKGDTIYYSRNLEVEGKPEELSSVRNKLGIFSAVLVGEEWMKIRELRINNEWYNVTTPWISSDGKKLYFASDKPGGFGGSDIYYSEWKSDYWNDPVNLGPLINSKGNESYPFVSAAGELFFSSDGHPGLGGKDIFFSRLADSSWTAPIGLEYPINSQFDDFSLIADTLMEEGYFTSNREKQNDIFHFKTIVPQRFYTNIQKVNQYCFTFSDSGSIAIDTINLEYVWSFGDGTSASGRTVKHCFPGSGVYYAKLDIFDRGTGNLFFSKSVYTVEIKDYEQPFINSDDFAYQGDSVIFDALKSNLSGYEILNYEWDFDDNTRAKGKIVKHSFSETGEFSVNLILTIRSLSTGNIQKTGIVKKIPILNNLQRRASVIESMSAAGKVFPDIRKYKNTSLKTIYSADAEINQSSEFVVELFTSKTRTNLTDTIYKAVSDKYTIIEEFDQDSSVFRYTIDKQLSLMATYVEYKDIIDNGFFEARTRMILLKDPAGKELNNLKKLFGVSTDSYFDANNRLTSNAYLLLDQIVKFLTKYPEVNIEIAVHTDNSGTVQGKLKLSDGYAKTMIVYLTGKGIDPKRLTGKGYGGARPIFPNSSDEERKLNRRIDFIILK